MSKKDNKKTKGYLGASLGAFFVILIVKYFWPEFIPFQIFEFFKLTGTIPEILSNSYLIFLWAFIVNLMFSIIKGNKLDLDPKAILIGGGLRSLKAGVLEEICFRWLLFYNEIVFYQIWNWLIFGFADHGFFQWLFLNVTGPIANFFTLGFLQSYLFDGFGWAVGAAILTSNGKFRDGHSYQGRFGWINSWFCGMFLFYLMFKYGIFAAMLVHFLYDIVCFFTVALVVAITNKD